MQYNICFLAAGSLVLVSENGNEQFKSKINIEDESLKRCEKLAIATNLRNISDQSRYVFIRQLATRGDLSAFCVRRGKIIDVYCLWEMHWYGYWAGRKAGPSTSHRSRWCASGSRSYRWRWTLRTTNECLVAATYAKDFSRKGRKLLPKPDYRRLHVVVKEDFRNERRS